MVTDDVADKWPLQRNLPDTESWSKVRKVGPNGLSLFLLGLAWWKSATTAGQSARREYSSVAEDVAWVISNIVKDMDPFASREPPVHSLHLLSHPLRPPRRALPSRPRREVAHPAPHRRSLVRWASPLRALNAPDWSNFTSRRFDSHCPPFCLSIVTASVCSRFSLRVSLSVSICLRVYTVFLPAFPSVVSSSYYLCCVTYASVCSRFSLRISQLVSICLRIYTVFFLPAFPSAVSSSYYLCCVT